MRFSSCVRTLMVVFLLLIAVTMSGFAQDDARRDGNWWKNIPTAGKLWYMAGVVEGMQLGRDVSSWLFQKNSASDACRASLIESFRAFRNNIGNSTNEQIADGLNEFYSDYRNRSILVIHGASVVMRAIGGESKSYLEEVTINLRRSDAFEAKDAK